MRMILTDIELKFPVIIGLDTSHMKINKAHLLLDFDYVVRNNSDFEYESLENFDHKFSINKFLF